MANTTLKNKLENVAGRLCEVLIPIKHEYYIGEGKSVAICTLSSMALLQAIAKTDDIMSRILIVGRLLSENKGLDTLVRFTLKQSALLYLVVCGKDVRGHQSGLVGILWSYFKTLALLTAKTTCAQFGCFWELK